MTMKKREMPIAAVVAQMKVDGIPMSRARRGLHQIIDEVIGNINSGRVPVTAVPKTESGSC